MVLMDPGWLVLCLALALECLLVSLLILPMPSNYVRGAITKWVVSLLSNQGVKYGGFCVLLLDAYYFAYSVEFISNPLVHVGFMSPVEEAMARHLTYWPAAVKRGRRAWARTWARVRVGVACHGCGKRGARGLLWAVLWAGLAGALCVRAAWARLRGRALLGALTTLLTRTQAPGCELASGQFTQQSSLTPQQVGPAAKHGRSVCA